MIDQAAGKRKIFFMPSGPNLAKNSIDQEVGRGFADQVRRSQVLSYTHLISENIDTKLSESNNQNSWTQRVNSQRKRDGFDIRSSEERDWSGALGATMREERGKIIDQVNVHNGQNPDSILKRAKILESVGGCDRGDRKGGFSLY